MINEAYEVLQAYSFKERSLYHNDQKGSKTENAGSL